MEIVVKKAGLSIVKKYPKITINRTLIREGGMNAIDYEYLYAHNHNTIYFTKNEMNDFLDLKSDIGHIHSISEVSNLQNELNLKALQTDLELKADTTELNNYRLKNVQINYNTEVSNKPTIPTALSQLTTDTNNQRVSTTDKTNYATAVSQTHTHSNKTLLDTYNQTNANLTDAVNLKHTHANKNFLDTVTALKTINNQSVIGSGNLTIEGGSGTTDHLGLSNIGVNTHAQIDTALARLANTSGPNTGDQDLSGYSLTTHNHSLANLDEKSYNSLTDKPTLFSGSYTDLSNKPSIPTALSDLTADSTHRLVSDTEKSTWNAKSDFNGSYTSLTNKPTIPTALSDLSQDLNYRTVTDVEKGVWNAKSNFSGSYVDLTNKPTIPANLSDLNKNINFDERYYTETETDTLLSGKQAAGTYSTDIHSNITALNAVSGTNTGDNAVNSLYSGLATSKQDTLVSGTNIKTINGSSVLGSGDLTISAGGLTNFTESAYTYSSKYGVKLTPNSAQTNVDVVLNPKGSGGILAQQPDGTTTGGNNRGGGAVDLQIYRDNAAQVASGGGSFIGGGYYNKATQTNNVVAGGSTNSSTGGYAAILGGQSNIASGSRSTVCAGFTNTASSDYSAILGGSNNEAKTNTYAAVLSGQYNQATGQYSVVCGGGGAATGNKNLASGTGSAVVGGNTNTASSSQDVVVGGTNNACNGTGAPSFIGGGSSNSLTGMYGAILGGTNNTIVGDFCTILGSGAKATNSYEVVMGIKAFSVRGDSERRLIGGSVETTSTSTYQISLDNTPTYMVLPNYSVWNCEISIIAQKANGSAMNAFCAKRYCLIGRQNGAGTTTISTVETIGTDKTLGTFAAPTIAITADTTTGYLKISITPTDATKTRWVVDAYIVQQGFDTSF